MNVSVDNEIHYVGTKHFYILYPIETRILRVGSCIKMKTDVWTNIYHYLTVNNGLFLHIRLSFTYFKQNRKQRGTYIIYRS